MNTQSTLHELSVTRLIDAPREAVYRAYTEHTTEWFAPKPWTTPVAELDLRPGGFNRITMRSPEGQDMPNEGVFLEVVPNEKLVFTDAFKGDWVPEGPFMVVIVTFDEEDGKTRYTARARHWSEETCKQHAAMGFVEGWGLCADQLAAVAEGLAEKV